jgi:hypothetical protein
MEGQGVVGDRYNLALEAGFYSHKPEEGRQITLFEIETLWALRRDHDIDLAPQEHRRKVTVEGVPLNHLVGRRFWLGETLLEATRAFPAQAYPRSYPAWMKELRQSAGWISSVAVAQALQRPSTVRLASLRKMFLNLAKACSIGSRSGL